MTYDPMTTETAEMLLRRAETAEAEVERLREDGLRLRGALIAIRDNHDDDERLVSYIGTVLAFDSRGDG